MILCFILLFALPVFSNDEVSDTKDEIALVEDHNLVDGDMTVCPFPPENAIEPCKCFMDKHLRYGSMQLKRTAHKINIIMKDNPKL